MKEPVYKYCATLADLAYTITARITKFDTNMIHSFGEITFRVEDTPGLDESLGMTTQDELREAYENANGTYGVRVLPPMFDQDETIVAVGYYGGKGIYTFAVSGDFTIGTYTSALKKQVLGAVTDAMISNADDGYMHNFLVCIKEADNG